jgi:octaprenyl-diphosphate synthase
MKHGTPEQAACVREAIVEGGRDAFPAVLAAVKASGALNAARAQAEAEAREAIAAIDAIPASVFKDALIELPAFSVSRRS